MNETEIKVRIQTALRTVQDLGDPYRGIAFQEVLRRVLAEEVSASKPPEGTKVPLAMSLNEFVASKSCKTLGDYTLCIFYWSDGNGLTPLTSKEAFTAFATAHLQRPKNISDVIGDLVRRGYLTEAAERKSGQKAFNITPPGKKYVESALQPDEQ